MMQPPDLSRAFPLLLLLFGVGCGAGSSSLVSVQEEPAGANCPEGGVAIQTGVDEDGDGALSAEEISQTSYVCDGADGADGEDGAEAEPASLLAVSPIEAGETCPEGGVRIDAGIDDDGDGILDPEEVDTTETLCDGEVGPSVQPLVELEPEPAGEHCPGGGVAVRIGYDADESGTLEEGEVTSVSYVCDGEDGPEPLTRVRGTVYLSDAVDLGLLAEVVQIDGDLYIEDVTAFTAVSLPALRQVGGTVFIQQSGDLVSVSLPALTSVGGLWLERLDVLTTLELSAQMAVLGELHLLDLPALGGSLALSVGADVYVQDTGLQGLRLALGPEVGRVEIGQNEALQLLDFGDAATAIRSDLAIRENPRLREISGLEGLSEVQAGFVISTNESLAALPTFAALGEVGEDLSLYGNPLISALPSFPALKEVGTVIVLECDLCQTYEGLAALTSAESLLLRGLPALTAMPSLPSLVSLDALTLEELPLLAQLPSLRSVHLRELEISRCDSLTSLAGLEQVGDLDSLVVEGNPRLERLDGLEGVDVLSYNLRIFDNDALVDIEALNGVQGTVVASVVSDNAALSQCAVDRVLAGLVVTGTTLYSNNLTCNSRR